VLVIGHEDIIGIRGIIFTHVVFSFVMKTRNISWSSTIFTKKASTTKKHVGMKRRKQCEGCAKKRRMPCEG
jgi:hypothetical protein